MNNEPNEAERVQDRHRKVSSGADVREIGDVKGLRLNLLTYVIYNLKLQNRKNDEMKGDAKQLVEFLDGAKNRFIIPVYQRNYDWTERQCRQLFNDLIQITVEKRKSHFFGSIVSTHASNGSKSDYLIIDGQQRITTISLLFTAMVNLLKGKILKSVNEKLEQEIEETFLIDKYRKEENFA